MSDLADSRGRIAEAADQERVRIERDLHDGAQQRLIKIESAVYFSCSEALQNPIKHAAGASAIWVRLR